MFYQHLQNQKQVNKYLASSFIVSTVAAETYS